MEQDQRFISWASINGGDGKSQSFQKVPTPLPSSATDERDGTPGSFSEPRKASVWSIENRATSQPWEAGREAEKHRRWERASNKHVNEEPSANDSRTSRLSGSDRQCIRQHTPTSESEYEDRVKELKCYRVELTQSNGTREAGTTPRRENDYKRYAIDAISLSHTGARRSGNRQRSTIGSEQTKCSRLDDK